MRHVSSPPTARAETLDALLRGMQDAQLLRQSGEAAFQFKHTMTQESVYDSLLKNDRRRLHFLVATALETTGEAPEDLAPLLARHWDDAGENERALTYYLLAGKHARRVSAYVEALMAYDRALALAAGLEPSRAQLVDLYLERGRVLELRNEYDRALANYQELQELAQPRGDPHLKLEGLIQRAKNYATPTPMQDLAYAEPLAQEALELARQLDDRPAIARVLWILLLIKQFGGAPEQAITFGEASLALARELGLREQQAYTLNDLMRSFAVTGQPEKARAAWEEADELWRELNDLPMQADNLANASLFAFFWGDSARGIAMAEQTLQITRQTSNTWGESYALSFLGMMNYIRGELASAYEHLARGAELGLQAQVLDPVADGSGFMALICREMGMRQQGIALLERALEMVAGRPAFSPSIHAAMTILKAEEGDLAGAQQAIAQAQAHLSGNLDSAASFLAGFGGISLALAQGNSLQAEAVAQNLLHSMEQAGVRPFNAMARLGMALAREQRGDLAGALETLEQARLDALETEGRTITLDIFTHAARMYERAGQLELARARRREAVATAEFLADHAPPGMRAAFLNRPEVQALFAKDLGFV